jgi:hypothetical protein
MIKIFKDDKLSGLFKGLKPKLIQTVLNSAILLMLYERIKLLLQDLISRK